MKMRILYYDCFAGISGDMNLGALIDLGVDINHLTTELEKLNIEEIQASSRKYPFISFQSDREPGGTILEIENLGLYGPDGNKLFGNLTFNVQKGDKIAFLSRDTPALNGLFQILAGELKPDEGSFQYGQTITWDYLPNVNDRYFSGANDMNLVEWLRQYAKSEEADDLFIRGFLGRMLFSGEEVLKKSSVLSGGEKVRCMLSKMMLSHPNLLIMDEPTNHLDLESIQSLNKAMKDFKGNLLFTSHDHQLVQTVATRIIEITPNGMIDSLKDFDEYLVSEDIKDRRKALLAGVATW